MAAKRNGSCEGRRGLVRDGPRRNIAKGQLENRPGIDISIMRNVEMNE